VFRVLGSPKSISSPLPCISVPCLIQHLQVNEGFITLFSLSSNLSQLKDILLCFESFFETQRYQVKKTVTNSGKNSGPKLIGTIGVFIECIDEGCFELFLFSFFGDLTVQ